MFDERIKRLRISLGMNQTQFGNKLNVSKQCISNWENSDILPSIDMLTKIALTFSVSADYLLGISQMHTIDVNGLTDEQILHLRNIAEDFRKLNKK